MSERPTGDVTDEWSIERVLAARNATAALLDALDLEGYLFEVEPRTADGVWEVRLEWVCGGPAGVWTTTRLEVDGASLLRSRDDERARARILTAWREHLEAARPEAPT